MPGVKEQEDFGSAGLSEKPGVGRREAAHSPFPSCWPSPLGRTRASQSWSEAQSPPKLTFCLGTQGPMTRNLFARAPAQLYSTQGPWSSRIRVPCELVRQADYRSHLRPTSGLHFSRFSGTLCHIWCLEVVASGKGIQAGTGSWEGWGYYY